MEYKCFKRINDSVDIDEIVDGFEFIILYFIFKKNILYFFKKMNDFDTHFNQYFDFEDKELQRKTRKLFKCTMTGLIRKYPDIFAYSKTQPILILSDKMEEAKEIMKSVYIPLLYENNTYYYYPSGQLYVKKDKSKTKFHEIYSSSEVDSLKKTGDLKALKEYLNENFSDKYTKTQLDNLAYRLIKNSSEVQNDVPNQKKV